jgi:hypothetical protein
MIRRSALCLGLLLQCTTSFAAELFYMDHDPFSNRYVGAVGPVVLSGDILPGDYDKLVAKIAEDEHRFITQGKLILASSRGDVPEAIKIAKLVRSMYTEVLVGPLTGKCAGPCFLIYSAAAQRGTDGHDLLGLYRPILDDADLAALPPGQVALRQDALAEEAAAFLRENAVPTSLLEELLKHSPEEAYWLTESDEIALGTRSPAFAQYLLAKCAWDEKLESDVYGGKRPLEELKQKWACRANATQAAAHLAFAAATKPKATPGKPH